MRYWDGAQWTDHVADAGTTSEDPYAAAPPPPPPPGANLSVVEQSRHGGAVSSADVTETEQTLWEGATENLAAVASKGKVVNARYRLTSKALYVSTGIVGSAEKRIPLDGVQDVTVQQSFVQKRRGVASLSVRYYDGVQRVTQIDSVPNGEQLRDLVNEYADYARRRSSRAQRTFYRGD